RGARHAGSARQGRHQARLIRGTRERERSDALTRRGGMTRERLRGRVVAGLDGLQGGLLEIGEAAEAPPGELVPGGELELFAGDDLPEGGGEEGEGGGGAEAEAAGGGAEEVEVETAHAVGDGARHGRAGFVGGAHRGLEI